MKQRLEGLVPKNASWNVGDGQDIQDDDCCCPGMPLKIGGRSWYRHQCVHAAEHIQDKEKSPGVPYPVTDTLLHVTLWKFQKEVHRAMHCKHRDYCQPSHQRVRTQ